MLTEQQVINTLKEKKEEKERKDREKENPKRAREEKRQEKANKPPPQPRKKDPPASTYVPHPRTRKTHHPTHPRTWWTRTSETRILGGSHDIKFPRPFQLPSPPSHSPTRSQFPSPHHLVGMPHPTSMCMFRSAMIAVLSCHNMLCSV